MIRAGIEITVMEEEMKKAIVIIKTEVVKRKMKKEVLLCYIPANYIVILHLFCILFIL